MEITLQDYMETLQGSSGATLISSRSSKKWQRLSASKHRTMFGLLGNNFMIICYFSNWAQSRPGIGRHLPDQIDPFLCTHLIYAFASMNTNHKLTTCEWNDDVLYKYFNDLKVKNRHLKTPLALGGWNFGSARFNSMVPTSENRAVFMSSVINFLSMHHFDGFDLDWENSGFKGNPAQSKQLFTTLLKVYRTVSD